MLLRRRIGLRLHTCSFLFRLLARALGRGQPILGFLYLLQRARALRSLGLLTLLGLGIGLLLGFLGFALLLSCLCLL